MTPKMVANFRRSVSLPNHPSHSSSKPRKAYHVRSTSLPCTSSHPLISHLKAHLTDLKSWSSEPHNNNNNRTSAWLCDGLSRLKTVHDYLDDILRLPQTLDSLRRHPHWIEKLLEHFLIFVDVYGIFQTLVLALKHEQSAAQAAIRRRDDSMIALHEKASKKLRKEMGNLVSTVRSMGNYQCSVLVPGVDAELAEVISEVSDATVVVSAAVFSGVSLLFAEEKWRWMGLRLGKKAGKERVEEVGVEECGVVGIWGLRKKGEEEVRVVLKRMHDLEEGIAGIENGSERVFRSLINTRVSLLNVLTH